MSVFRAVIIESRSLVKKEGSLEKVIWRSRWKQSYVHAEPVNRIDSRKA